MATPQALIDAVTRNAVYIERLKNSEVRKFETFLREIDKSLRERLQGSELTQFNRERLERLLYSVDQMLSEVFARHYNQLSFDLVQLANFQGEREAGIINSVSAEPENLEFVIPSPAQMRAAVFSSPLSVRGPDGGKLLEPFIKDWSKAEADAIVGAIRQGYFEGQTNAQIVQKIRGTKANKYRDGILSTTTRHAEAITRTAIQHAAVTARIETMKENRDICKGIKWISTLDSRTTAPCRSLDGTTLKFDKGPRPPLHINCRSTVVEELSNKYKWLDEGATRASKDGPVDATETYYSWLKRQPESFQNEVLGVKRAKLLRDGGLSADAFAKLSITKDYKPMTLEEMMAENPLAFKRAGVKV